MTDNPSYNPVDRNDFERIFTAYFEDLCRFAYSYVNDTDNAQEIVQDVFIRLWQNKETYDAGKPVKPYLYTAVKNRCLNYIRDHKKFRSYYLDVELELEIPVEDRDMIEASEVQERINRALDKLPPKCREVFELSRFEELKYKEISQKMEISVKTVEVHMSKALSILREELGDLIVWLLIFMALR